MKVKLLLTMAYGIISFEVYGANLVEDDPNSVTGGGATEKVVIQVDESDDTERAGSPAIIVRNKGKGVQGLKSINPNLSTLKKDQGAEVDPVSVPRRLLNLGDGTPRTNSDLLSSEGDSSIGGSTAGSPSVTPKAADAAENTGFSAN